MKYYRYTLEFLTILLLAFLTISSPAVGQQASDSVALTGYDPVAYFEQGRPMKGLKEQHVTYEGATYLFYSEENKALFEQNPDQYLPAFDGWCAFAVAKKSARKLPDPRIWKIQDGRLLLFSNASHTHVDDSYAKAWNKKPEQNLFDADYYWMIMNLPAVVTTGE